MGEGQISLEVLAERLGNAIDGIKDIRDHMVDKEVYQGEMKQVREAISNERVERAQAIAELKADLVGQISALRTEVLGQVKEVRSDVDAAKSETAAVKSKQDERRFTVRSGILIGVVVALAGGLITVLYAALSSAAHLAP